MASAPALRCTSFVQDGYQSLPWPPPKKGVPVNVFDVAGGQPRLYRGKWGASAGGQMEVARLAGRGARR